VDDVVIRRPVAEDFDEWFDLFQEVADEARWIGREGPLDREDRRQAFERTLEADDAQAFIAERDGTVVGALGVTIEHGLAELGMMVRPAERGRGIGTALIASCLGWCRDRQAHKLTLMVWPHNERAIALYRNFGFVVEGRLARHHRRRSGELWDALVMGLVLDTTSPGSKFVDAPSASRSP
jgi:RimJ/RimL family protein N-acetyltransferase